MYTVTETQPAGYLDGREENGSPPAIGSNDRFSNIDLTSAPFVGNGYNFGELLPARVSGLVFSDYNANRIQDASEPGRAGIVVTLTGTDDLGNPINFTATTAADGSYGFSNLRPGTYALTETVPADASAGASTPGTTGGTSSAPNLITGVVVTSGADSSRNNFSLVQFTVPNPLTPVPSPPVIFPPVGERLVPQDGGKRNLFGSTPPQEMIDAYSVFVQGLYRSVLGRNADQTGLDLYVGMLITGVPREWVVQSFSESAEHRGLQVEAYYAMYLRRAADPVGRAFWVAAMGAGLSETDVVLALVTSAEYQASRADDTAYLRGLYQDVLGRAADAAGLAMWQQTLQAGFGRAAVARAFLTSEETYRRVVDSYYLAYFHRPADQAGEALWVALLRNGQLTPGQTAQALLASTEYFGNAQRAV